MLFLSYLFSLVVSRTTERNKENKPLTDFQPSSPPKFSLDPYPVDLRVHKRHESVARK